MILDWESLLVVLLFSDGARKRCLRLDARPPRQVTGHQINHHGRKHQNHANPDTPITVRACPVRTMCLMDIAAIRISVLVVTLLYLIHFFSAFSMPSPSSSHFRA